MKTAALLVFFLSLSACAISPRPDSVAGYAGHGAKSLDAATLAKYAPAPLPPEISRRVQSVLDLRSPGVGMIDSTGQHLFFSWSVTGTSQIWRLDGPKHFPVQMTGGEDATTLAAITPDGKWLLLERDQNGEENPGLYRQSTAGGALEPIQHKQGVQTSFQFVTQDSRAVFYRSNDIQSDSYAIYRYDLLTGARELIFSGDGNWFVDDLDESRQKILLGKSTSNIGSEHYELDLRTKEKTPVIGQGEVEEYTIQYGAKPGEFVVLTPKIGEYRRLYRLQKGQLHPVLPDLGYDVAGFAVDPKRERVVYSVNDRGYGKLDALDAKTWRKIPLPAFPKADQVYLGAFSQNGKRMTVGVETATAPRVSYVYDWESGKATQWVIPSSPEMDMSRFVSSSLESYPARDGTKIPMFVLRPKGCERGGCPVIVHFHGGPEGQSTPGFWAFAQMLVEAGFVFVEPNVRGSDGYGKSWLNVDNGAKRLNVISDIEDCAQFIRSNWSQPGKSLKVGVMGWSYGGYSTLLAMSRFSGAYDAGVAMVGMSNLVTFLENTAPYRRALRTPEYGDPAKDREALTQLSPSTYLDKIKAPLLIIQGASDPRVPAGEAVQIKNALDKKGIPAELIIFADEGHGATKRVNRVYESGHLLRFFKEHLTHK